MSFPPLITICGQVYHVIVMHRLKDGELGACDQVNRVIYLSRRQKDDELIATFWHEFCHAVEAEESIVIGHKIITKLEYAIVEVLAQLKRDDF